MTKLTLKNEEKLRHFQIRSLRVFSTDISTAINGKCSAVGKNERILNNISKLSNDIQNTDKGMGKANIIVV
jgi:hypothetical protein